MGINFFTSIAVLFCAFVIPTSGTILVPKNVIFGVSFGGRSHINWVLATLDELAGRGHNVTYAAGHGYSTLADKYQSFHTISVSGEALREIGKSLQPHADWCHVAVLSLPFQDTSYVKEFNAFKSIFQEANADVVLCDYFAPACIDAAISLRLPLIGTSFIASSPDAIVPYVERDFFALVEPTTLTTSFASRFYHRYFLMFEVIIRLWLPIQKFIDVRRQVDAPPLSVDPLKDSLKIVNSAFGFEPARPLGPLVEMVGPIVDSKFLPLSPKLETYLNDHSRVALVSFGQHVTPTRNDIQLIIRALVDNIEARNLDGFIWAKVGLDMRDLPESVVSSSGTSYNVTNILGGSDPHMWMESWVPQQAILHHPSVCLFLSHGGVGSIHESLVGGVPLVVFPLVGDQPVNARMVEEIGVGKFLDFRVTFEQASAILEAVAQDVTGEFKKNVERYGAFIRMRSARGASKSADLVEEVMILHKDGLLPHRYEASRQMSYLKATNLDLDLAMALLVILVAWLSYQAAVVLKERLRIGKMKSKTH